MANIFGIMCKWKLVEFARNSCKQTAYYVVWIDKHLLINYLHSSLLLVKSTYWINAKNDFESYLCCSTGFKLRKRKIINEPTGGTGNCPHLTEAIPCEEPSCYDWLLVKLEDCVPDNDKVCGPGTQNPQVQCINSDGKWYVHLPSAWYGTDSIQAN